LKDWFRRTVEKYDLQEHNFGFAIEQKIYHLNMEKLIEVIEEKSHEEKKFINRTINELSILDQNILGFLEFLAKSHIMRIHFEKTKMRSEGDIIESNKIN
jgi:hypothetical protein